MSGPMEQARRQLEAARQKVEALSRVPEHDHFPIHTILRWRATGNVPHVAIKVPAWGVHTVRWQVSGRREDLYTTWERIVSTFLSGPLDYFEVAPLTWTDATVAPVEVTEPEGSLVLTDRATNRQWTLRGDDWVRE